MRYSEDIIEEVRSRNDIVDVVSGYVKLTKKGANYFGLCPFHNEKSASFSVNQGKQIFYCFGCGAGGNVFRFLMDYDNMTFTEALKALADRAGIALPEQQQTEEERREEDRKKRLFEAVKSAGIYYNYLMNKTARGKRALDYFLGRGLTTDTIRKFGLGYSDTYRDDLYQYLKSKGYEDSLLKDTGLVKISETEAHDMFFNRAMFPIMDANNRIIAFGGRVMGEGEPKYLNSPENPLFNKSRNLYGLNYARSTRKPYFLICEGYMDVISLHQAGFTNAVAPLGTALTPGQASIIKRYVNQVILTFDSDGAGTKAARRAIPIFKEAGISCKVLNMKPYKDPDEFIKNLGAEEYQKRIDEAENSFLFEIRVLSGEYDMADPDQKTAFWREVAQRLAAFSDEIERNSYVDAVARRFSYDASLLRRNVNAIGSASYNPERNESPKEYESKKKKEKVDGLKKSERLMLTWLSVDENLFPKISLWLSEKDFPDDPYAEAAGMVFAALRAGQKPNPAKILDSFMDNEERYREVAALFSTSIDEELSDEERMKAITETVKRLRKNSLEQQFSHATDLGTMQTLLAEQRALEQLKSL